MAGPGTQERIVSPSVLYWTQSPAWVGRVGFQVSGNRDPLKFFTQTLFIARICVAIKKAGVSLNPERAAAFASSAKNRFRVLNETSRFLLPSPSLFPSLAASAGNVEVMSNPFASSLPGSSHPAWKCVPHPVSRPPLLSPLAHSPHISQSAFLGVCTSDHLHRCS